MNNHWVRRAEKKKEEERIRQKYAGVNLFEEHLDLVKRVVDNGFGSLTKKERLIVRKGKPEPIPDVDHPVSLLAYCSDLCMDELIIQTDLKVFGEMLGYL